MDITVEGLNSRQRKLADMLWACDSQEAVTRFIAGLPSEYKQEAQTVHELMIAAVWDTQEDVSDDVKSLISSIASR